MFSDEVDEIWHEMIMYTRNYQNFCEAFIGRMIHHAPKFETKSIEEIEMLYFQKADSYNISIIHRLIKTMKHEIAKAKAKKNDYPLILNSQISSRDLSDSKSKCKSDSCKSCSSSSCDSKSDCDSESSCDSEKK